MLTVIKSGNHYMATATPPHVHEEWNAKTPLDKQLLIRILVEMGSHISDIGDVIHEADVVGRGHLS